jgi:hypothetical protein
LAVVLDVVTRGTMMAAITPRMVTTASNSSSEKPRLRNDDLDDMELKLLDAVDGVASNSGFNAIVWLRRSKAFAQV